MKLKLLVSAMNTKTWSRNQRLGFWNMSSVARLMRYLAASETV